MTIPSSNEIIRPTLEYLAESKEPVRLIKLVEVLGEKFELTKEELKETVDSGGNRLRARTITAINKMKSSRQISSPQRGYLEITDKGREEVEGISPPAEETTGNRLLPRPPLPIGEAQEPRADTAPQGDKTAEIVGQIITAYVSRPDADVRDLPKLVKDTYDALSGAKQQPAASTPSSPERTTSQEPAVPTDNSVTDDYIFCLECGKAFVSLKRHLKSHHSMTPEEYRKKWGLLPDYPMIAKKFSERRSKTAKSMGFGKNDK